jgi:hypothetical protein
MKRINLKWKTVNIYICNGNVTSVIREENKTELRKWGGGAKITRLIKSSKQIQRKGN